MRVALLAVAAIAALAAAAPASAAGSVQQLANRYAPIVALADQSKPCEQGEPWRPVSADIVLGNPEVQLRGPDRYVEKAPTAADLYDKGPGYYLNYPGNPNIPRCRYDRDGKQFARGHPSIAYAHLVARPADPAAGVPAALALQYWFFYYFNDYNDKHEADWEGIQLVFPAATAQAALATQPAEVGYAQHGGGERAGWEDDKLDKVGTHPIVYSAVGSHASYYSSALWLGASASEGVGCDDTRGPNHFVPLRAVVLPSRAASSSSPYAWLDYEGRWGQKLPGANNGPTGPNTKARWSDPFAWQDGLRSSSIALPGGETLGPSVSGAFCGTVAALSTVLTYFYNSPAPTIGVLALVLATLIPLAIWLVRRSTWSARRDEPIRSLRSIGQILRGAVRLYWRHGWLFLGLGLLSVVVFLLVRGLEALLHLAFSRFGDFSITLSGTALAALAVNAAVAIALDRLDRSRRVRVLGTYGQVLRRALPLLAALVLEEIAILVVIAVAVGVPVLVSLYAPTVGDVLLIIGIVLLVWWLARPAVGWAFTSQQIYVDRRSAFWVVFHPAPLIKRNWWRSVILLVVLYLVGLVAGPVVGFVVLFLARLDPLYLDLLGSAVYVLIFPFVAISATLLFFDLQARRSEAERPAAEAAASPAGGGS